jgi:hypothetical protein
MLALPVSVLRLQGSICAPATGTGSFIWSPSCHGNSGRPPPLFLLLLPVWAQILAPAVLLQPHSVPDCPAMWVPTRWLGQLLRTCATHHLPFLLAWACSCHLPYLLCSHTYCLVHQICLQNKSSKAELLRVSKQQRQSIKPRARPILRAGPCMIIQVAGPGVQPCSEQTPAPSPVFCSTGAWTQGLHFEPLHQPFYWKVFFFWDRASKTICPGGFKVRSSWSLPPDS